MDGLVEKRLLEPGHSPEPELKIIRPRNDSSERPRQYVGIALGRSADHVDQNVVVQTVRSPEHCSSNGPCPACDGEGCPWCQPEKHGLPPRPDAR